MKKKILPGFELPWKNYVCLKQADRKLSNVFLDGWVDGWMGVKAFKRTSNNDQQFQGLLAVTRPAKTGFKDYSKHYCY